MTVPATLEEWFSGAPWSAPGVPFHDYWTEVLRGEREASPLMRFGHGKHELAHYAWCEDSEVLDPTYGFGPLGDPLVESDDPRAIRVESSLCYVEAMLEMRYAVEFQYLRAKRPDTDTPPYALFYGFNGQDGQLNLPPKVRSNTYREARRRFPTIEALWAEVQRKDALVRALLEKETP